MAAQMLSGKGFNDVINMAGGIKAWDSQTAVGDADLGLELFTGTESLAATLVVAYSLEAGLREFYLSMIRKVGQEEIRELFQKLSEIETLHQDRIYQEYLSVSGNAVDRATFDGKVVPAAVEGGMTTDEYAEMFQPDWDSAVDVISLAMSIEAQALDLYTRAADRNDNPESKKALKKIAEEERVHLEQLGKLMDQGI